MAQDGGFVEKEVNDEANQKENNDVKYPLKTTDNKIDNDNNLFVQNRAFGNNDSNINSNNTNIYNHQNKGSKHDNNDNCLNNPMTLLETINKIKYDGSQGSDINNFDELEKSLESILTKKNADIDINQKILNGNEFQYIHASLNYKKLNVLRLESESIIAELSKYYKDGGVLYNDKLNNAENSLMKMISRLSDGSFRTNLENILKLVQDESILAKQGGLADGAQTILSEIEKTFDKSKKELENRFPDNPIKAFFVNLWIFILHYVIGVTTYHDLVKSFYDNINDINKIIATIKNNPASFPTLKDQLDEMLAKVQSVAKYTVTIGSPINLESLKNIEVKIESLRNNICNIQYNKENNKLTTSFDATSDSIKAYSSGIKFIFSDSGRIFVQKPYSPQQKELQNRLELNRDYICNVLTKLFQQLQITEPTPNAISEAVCNNIDNLLNINDIKNPRSIEDIINNLKTTTEDKIILSGMDAVVYNVNKTITEKLEIIQDEAKRKKTTDLIISGYYAQYFSGLQSNVADEMREDKWKKYNEEVKKINEYKSTVDKIVDVHKRCIGQLFELLDKTIHKELSCVDQYIKKIGLLQNTNDQFLANNILYSKIKNIQTIIINKIKDETAALQDIATKYNIPDHQQEFLSKENKFFLEYYQKEVDKNVNKNEPVDEKNQKRLVEMIGMKGLVDDLKKFNIKNDNLTTQDYTLKQYLEKSNMEIIRLLENYTLSDDAIIKWIENNKNNQKEDRMEHNEMIKSIFDIVKTQLKQDPHNKNLERVYGILEKLATGRNSHHSCNHDHHSEHHDHCHSSGNMNNNVYNNTNTNQGIGYNNFNNVGINNSATNNLNNKYPPDYNKDANNIQNHNPKNPFMSNQNPTVKAY